MRVARIVAANLALLAPSISWAQVQAEGTAELVSDYRYRGTSLSNGHPALQVSAEVERAGLSLSGFGSWVPKGGGSTAIELDATIGYRVALSGELSLNGGFAWYDYPGARNCDYGEAAGSLAWKRGSTTVRAGLAFAPRQAALVDAAGSRSGDLYGFVALRRELPPMGLELSVEAGYESGAFDGAARGGKLDLRSAVTAPFGPLYLTAAYIVASRPQAMADERRGEHGMVLSLGTAF